MGWSLLAKYIDSASLEKLEPAASHGVNMKSKNKKSVLSTSLGASIILTLILKASLDSGKTNNNLNTWSLLARTLLSLVAEGAVLGAFLARFSLSESSLASLLSLDNTLKPAWINIMVRVHNSDSRDSHEYIKKQVWGAQILQDFS